MLGVFLLWIAYRVFDKLTPSFDTSSELQRGNTAVAYWICTVMLIIGAILCVSINAGMGG